MKLSALKNFTNLGYRINRFVLFEYLARTLYGAETKKYLSKKLASFLYFFCSLFDMQLDATPANMIRVVQNDSRENNINPFIEPAPQIIIIS